MPLGRLRARPAFVVAFGAVLVLGVVPLLFVILRGVRDPGLLMQTLTGDDAREAAWGTLRLALLTTMLAVGIGTPLAWLTTRTDLPARGFLRGVLTIPYIVPPYIAAVAWIYLANPSSGLLGRVLGAGTLDIYTFFGLAWVLALSSYPYVLLTVRAALENADPSLDDAARMSGAGTWRVFKDITLPLLRPAVFASAGLVFMVTASAFGAPVLIGDPARIRVLSTLVFEELQMGDADAFGRAASLALLLLLFVLVPLVLRARHYATLGGRAARPTRLPLGVARAPIGIAVGVFALVAVVLPVLSVFATAFMRVAGDLSPANFTLENLKVLSRPDIREALGTSLGLAGGAATLAALIGGVVAYYRIKTRQRGRGLLDLLASVPLATPGTVLAIGLLLLWSSQSWLTNAVWILLIAYVAKYTALASRAIGEGIGTVDDVLPEAARLSGARGMFLARTIWVPLVLPSLVAGWFLVFMPCFAELTMSILLVSPGIETVGTRLFELQEYEAPVSASVLASVVILLVVGANLLIRLVSRGRYGV